MPPLTQHALTPKLRTRCNIFPSYASSPLEARLRPPINSLRGSPPSQASGDQDKEVEVDEDAGRNDQVLSPSGTIRDHRLHQRTRQRNPFRDIINQYTPHTMCLDHGRHHTIEHCQTATKNSRRKPLVQLPDVTGLTSAVESPAKPASSHYILCADDHFWKTECALLSGHDAFDDK
jgi:hypothetical protein